MRNFNENTITAAVLARFGDAGSTRVTELSAALVRHVHAFIRETRPTQAEWAAGIDFLTRTGQMCSETRQEFILLSDVLGVSMLVDAINHPLPEGATETTVLGPFHRADAPELSRGSAIAAGSAGVPLFVEGTVRQSGGAPIAAATIDTWHADGAGFYDVQRGEGSAPDLDLRARFRTDEQGRFWFRSIVPSCYPIPNDGPVGQMLRAQGRYPYRPAHIHFMIAAAGFETLVTHVFLAGDPYLDSDVVFGVKDSLIRELHRQERGRTRDGHEVDQPIAVLHYDFVLSHRSGEMP